MDSKKNRGLVIQTNDGEIYAISADKLGAPIGGDPRGIAKLRAALGPHLGKAIGLRVAVMGYELISPIGQNNIVSTLHDDLGGIPERDREKK
jgi:hypothetical protein